MASLVSPYRAKSFNGRQFSPLHLDGPSLYDPTFPVSSCRLRIFDNRSALCRSSPSSTRRGGVQIWCHGLTGAHAAGSGSNHIFVRCRHLAEIREQVARDLCTSATTRLPQASVLCCSLHSAGDSSRQSQKCHDTSHQPKGCRIHAPHN